MSKISAASKPSTTAEEDGTCADQHIGEPSNESIFNKGDESDTVSDGDDDSADDQLDDKKPLIYNIKHMRCGLWKRKNCIMKKARILA